MKRGLVKRFVAGALTAVMCVTQIPFSGIFGGVDEIYAEETNLLTGGGFESEEDLASWTIAPSGKVQVTNVANKEGNYSLAITPDSSQESSVKITKKLSELEAGTYKLTISTMGKGGKDFKWILGGSEGEVEDTTYNKAWNTWNTYSKTFTVEENKTGYEIGILAELWKSSDWYCIDAISLIKEAEETVEDVYTLDFQYNADITAGDTVTFTAQITKNGKEITSLEGLHLYWWCEKEKDDCNKDAAFSSNDLLENSIKLPTAGTYQIKATLQDASCNDLCKPVVKDITVKAVVHDDLELSLLIEKAEKIKESGFTEATWNNFQTVLTAVKNDRTAEGAYDKLNTAMEALRYKSSDIYVEKVNGLTDEFIKGVDISSYLSEKNSGVVYKDQSGTSVVDKEFIRTFAEVGVNYIRLRVWNAPYVVGADGTPAKDAQGNTKYYGGGNNDIATTLKLCKIIKEYNDTYKETYGEMKVLIDLQYSDFWADPDKQTPPKAWKDYTIEQKKTAVKEFTQDTLAAVEETGVTVGMIQIGNETNTGICGEKFLTQGYRDIFKAGCDAVKEYNESKSYTVENGKWIKRVVHFTDPHSAGLTFASELYKNGVEFDVYATSYYPFWHGTTDNLQKMLSEIATTCGCEVMVAETQYPYTNEDYDGADNQAYEGKENIDLSKWSVSVQGQAKEIRDVINAVAQATNGIGMFYWEPGWLGVGNAYNSDGSENASALAGNREKWNTYGSGWASDYAKEYDEQAEKWGGGGTNNENASLFDFTGNPLESLNVFKYVNYGAVPDKIGYYRADDIASITVENGADANKIKNKLATSIGYQKIDGSVSDKEMPITWSSSSINSVVNKIATTEAIGNSYIVEGTITVEGVNHTVRSTVFVEPAQNLVLDAGFEESESSTPWVKQSASILFKINGDTRNNSAMALKIDTYKSVIQDMKADESGCYSSSVYQKIENLPAGKYEAKAFFQGLDKVGSRAGENLCISVKYGADTVVTSNSVKLEGWMKWQPATISNLVITDEMVQAKTNNLEIYINATLKADSWGTVDDIYLYKTGDISKPNNSNNNSNNNYIPDYSDSNESTSDSTDLDNADPDNADSDNADSGNTDSGSESTETPDTGVDSEETTDSSVPEAPNVSESDKEDENSKTTTTTVTNKDGSVTTTTITENTDGSKVKNTVTEKKNGSKVEHTEHTDADGSIKTIEKVTDKKGATVTTTTTQEKNSKGNKVKVVVVENANAKGKVTGIVETSTITDKKNNAQAVITTEKDSKGKTKSVGATVEKKGVATASGSSSKVTLQKDVVTQIVTAAETKNLEIKLVAKDKNSKEIFTCTVNAKDLKSGKTLTIYEYDEKTNTYTMVNAKTYKVSEKGNITVSAKKGNFVLLNSTDSKKVNKEIVSNIKLKDTNKTVKVGKNTTVKLDSKADKNSVKSIKYASTDKTVATISQDGKITAKKSGTVKVTAKVTLKNGTVKTVSMKVKVKK